MAIKYRVAECVPKRVAGESGDPAIAVFPWGKCCPGFSVHGGPGLGCWVGFNLENTGAQAFGSMPGCLSCLS